MKHGFFILTHFPPEHTYRQVQRLMAENHYFFIHTDKKVAISGDDPYFKLLTSNPNVVLVEKRHDVKWAGFTTLSAIMELIDTGLKNSEIDYFHFLSGQCMPVKTNDYLDAFFEKHRGTEFMEYYVMPENGFGVTQWRLDKYHLYDYFNPKSNHLRDKVIGHINTALRASQRFLKRMGIYRHYSEKFPLLYGGATYWSITYGACKYVSDFVKENSAFYNRFKYTQSADEMFLQTIVMAGPFATNVVNDMLRFTNFEGGKSNAMPLTMANISNIKKPNIIFARKFTEESIELLTYLDTHPFKD